MRLDKYLCDGNYGTRSQVKKDIREGFVSVNAAICKKPEYQVAEKDQIFYKGVLCSYDKMVYLMLNKPAGVVSATRDERDRTVLDLIEENDRRELFPVGRLDKDTEGLLLLTNDGQLAHELLSPRRHIQKVYECQLANPISEEAKRQLEEGVDIGEKHRTLPAQVEILEEKRIRLTITEGKFHQVKRMLKAVDNEVRYLKRLQMGTLILDERLPVGSYRKLTEEERRQLCCRQ